ncbi:MAG: DUF4112 domain-containing protein [Proteobacteria bacterium]|jgi:hypothetical protein|nr:DUF4112 domain-containing protein [Pseudomonadota bacterium]
MPTTVSHRIEIIPPGKLSAEEQLAQLEWIADLLDSRFVIPGTNVRFGLDGVIGLIPIAGDILSALISFYLISRASELGLSPWVKTRMVWNVALDTVVGAVPVLGDMFDVSFKSNRRNIALARRYLAKHGARRR